MEQRLQILEVQAAKQGINTPPEVVLEINDLQADLRRIDKAMQELEREFFVQPDLTPAGMYELFVGLRDDVHRALGSTYGEVLKIRDIVDVQAAAQRTWQATETTARQRQQRWQQALVAAVVVLVMVVVIFGWGLVG
jgi:hypothetical protein